MAKKSIPASGLDQASLKALAIELAAVASVPSARETPALRALALQLAETVPPAQPAESVLDSGTMKIMKEASEAADRLSKRETYCVGSMELGGETAEDRLYTRLRHAHALICMITGDGASAFNNLNHRISDDYLCCVKDLISAAEVDAEIVTARHVPVDG